MEPAGQRHDPVMRSAIAEEVRALMGRRRVTQEKLAAAIGMSQPSLSKRLFGVVPWTIDDLEAIADYFGVKITDLLPIIRWNMQGAGPDPFLTSLPMPSGQLEIPYPATDRVLVPVP